MHAMAAARQLPGGESMASSMTKSRSAPNLKVLPGGDTSALAAQSQGNSPRTPSVVYRPVATRPAQNLKNNELNNQALPMARQPKSSLTHVQSAPSLHAMV